VTVATAGVGTGRELVLDDDVAAEVFSPAAAAVDFISVFTLLLPEALPLPLVAGPAGVALAASGTVTVTVPEF
jgi:hypothetical protein